MISTTQLRIGNWVSFKGLWEVQVSGIRGSVIYIDGNQGVFMDENFDPIDLTAEILEACGFEQKAIGYYWKNDYCVYYTNSGLHQYKIHKEGVYYPPIIASLHQLQNLFFALTGQELQYSPK